MTGIHFVGAVVVNSIAGSVAFRTALPIRFLVEVVFGVLAGRSGGFHALGVGVARGISGAFRAVLGQTVAHPGGVGFRDFGRVDGDDFRDLVGVKLRESLFKFGKYRGGGFTNR